MDKDDVSPCTSRVSPVASSYVGTLLPRVSVTAGGARAWQWNYVATIALTGQKIVDRIEEASGTVRQDERIVYSATGLTISDQVAVGDSIVSLWRDQGGAGTLEFSVRDTLTGADTGPLTLDPATVFRFAASEYDSTSFVVAAVSTAFPGTIFVTRYDLAGNVLSTANHAVAPAVLYVAIHALPGIGAALTWGDGASVSSARLVDLSWAISWGPVVDIAPPVFVSALGVALDDAADSTTAATVSDAIPGTYRTETVTRDGLGVSTATTRQRNTMMDLQPFRHDGCAFVVTTAITEDGVRHGATMLVAVDTDDAPTLVSTVLREGIGQGGTAGLFAIGGTLARAPMVDALSWLLPLSVQHGSTLSYNAAYNVTISSATLDFEQRQSGLRWGAEQRDCLAHSGGYADWYDGTAVVEQGFTQQPNVRDVLQFAIGGFIAPGTYLYQFVWEWTDERGNLHQSGPSLPLRVVVPAGPATNLVQINVDTMALTRKGDIGDGVAKQVTLAVFRTVAGGDTLFYRLTPVRGLSSEMIPNSKFVDFVSFVDTHNDQDLNGSTPLDLGFIYTNGGVRPNEFPPAPVAIVSTKNRLWLGSGRELWFSKSIVQGEGPGYSSEFVLTLDDANDEITALGALDDKVIVFTRDRIYYVTGDGPNDANGGGSFLGPYRLPTDDGCADQRSCVAYGDGLFYWDGTALQRMSRAMQIEPAGDPVLDLTSNATGIVAKLDPPTQRIYFLCNRPALLGQRTDRFAVFDYRFGQWVTQTNWSQRAGDPPYDAPCRVVGHHWLSGEHWITVDDDYPAVGRTGYGTYPGWDFNIWFPATLQTPWLHVAGVNGYQRVWDVTVTGRRLTFHNLNVEVLTDYDEATIRQSMRVDVGPTSPMLGLPVERLTLHMRAQLCSAVRVRLYDTAPAEAYPTGNPTGWDVAGVTLGIGVKPGNARLPAQNRAG